MLMIDVNTLLNNSKKCNAHCLIATASFRAPPHELIADDFLASHIRTYCPAADVAGAKNFFVELVRDFDDGVLHIGAHIIHTDTFERWKEKISFMLNQLTRELCESTADERLWTTSYSDTRWIAQQKPEQWLTVVNHEMRAYGHVLTPQEYARSLSNVTAGFVRTIAQQRFAANKIRFFYHN